MLWPDPSLGHTNVQCSLLTAMVSTLNRACRPKVSLLPEVMLRTTPGLSKDTSSNDMSSAQVWLGTQLENATKPLQVATVRPLQYLFFPFSLSVCRSRKSLYPTSLPGQAYMYKRDLDRYRDTMEEAVKAMSLLSLAILLCSAQVGQVGEVAHIRPTLRSLHLIKPSAKP